MTAALRRCPTCGGGIMTMGGDTSCILCGREPGLRYLSGDDAERERKLAMQRHHARPAVLREAREA